jgi:hypothetical protein
VSQKRDDKDNKPAPKTDLSAERRQRGDATESSAADQLGATEEQVVPLTPPMAKSDEQPGQPDRKHHPDAGIDPADELTPG